MWKPACLLALPILASAQGVNTKYQLGVTALGGLQVMDYHFPAVSGSDSQIALGGGVLVDRFFSERVSAEVFFTHSAVLQRDGQTVNADGGFRIRELGVAALMRIPRSKLTVRIGPDLIMTRQKMVRQRGHVYGSQPGAEVPMEELTTEMVTAVVGLALPLASTANWSYRVSTSAWHCTLGTAREHGRALTDWRMGGTSARLELSVLRRRRPG